MTGRKTAGGGTAQPRGQEPVMGSGDEIDHLGFDAYLALPVSGGRSEDAAA
jgi:hypothetical protein